MKTRFLKIISGMTLATVLALTVTQVSAFAQSAQKQLGIELGLGCEDNSCSV